MRLNTKITDFTDNFLVMKVELLERRTEQN